jgi:hypothetical protein
MTMVATVICDAGVGRSGEHDAGEGFPAKERPLSRRALKAVLLAVVR